MSKSHRGAAPSDVDPPPLTPELRARLLAARAWSKAGTAAFYYGPRPFTRKWVFFAARAAYRRIRLGRAARPPADAIARAFHSVNDKRVK